MFKALPLGALVIKDLPLEPPFLATFCLVDEGTVEALLIPCDRFDMRKEQPIQPIYIHYSLIILQTHHVTPPHFYLLCSNLNIHSPIYSHNSITHPTYIFKPTEYKFLLPSYQNQPEFY